MKTLLIILTLVTASVSNAQVKPVRDLASKIAVLVGSEDTEHNIIAHSVYIHSKANGIDATLVIAILMTESTFNQSAVSSTGDLGIGQINPKVWGAELKRLKRKPLDIKRLKKDMDYAVARTVEILSIVKKDSDPYWVGRYHSKTPSLKKAYFVRVQKQLQKLQANKPVKVERKIAIASN